MMLSKKYFMLNLFLFLFFSENFTPNSFDTPSSMFTRVVA